MKTNQQAIIESIGATIVENYLTPKEARAINDSGGWSFDIRLPEDEYINDTDYTRINNINLSEADMEAAIKFAHGLGGRE